MEQQLNSSTGGWIGDDRRDEADFTSVSQTIAKPNVICRAAFKGEVTNEQYDIVMKYINDMQTRGWVWTVAYTEGRDENLYIDYVVEKHGT